MFTFRTPLSLTPTYLLVFLLLCSILGILYPLPNCFYPWFGLFIVVLCISLSAIFIWKKRHYSAVIACGICLFIVGGFKQENIPKLPQQQGFVFRLNKVVKKNENVTATAEWFALKNQVLVPSGIQVNCNLQYSNKLANGTLIYTTTVPRRIEKNSNPGAFDAFSYYQNKHIYYQAFLGADFLVIGQKKEWDHYIADLREFLSIALSKHLSGESFPLAKALLLGDASTINPSIKKDFSITGAIHVLAVSGMHIALFAQLLLFTFGQFAKWISKVNALVICIIVLWFYAILTGLSPSVLRSVLMFTLIQIGVFIGRDSPDNHILLFCAWIMISLDRNCIYDLGFQLSFLAVFGISNYQKKIKELFQPLNRMLSFFWEATAVAVAAQLFTIPIILYNFHTFPNYFLFANLLVVVISSIAMYLGFAYLFLNFVPLLGYLLGELFHYTLKAMHRGLNLIAHLPGSVANGFQLSNWMVLILFAAILIFMHGNRLKSFRFLPITIICTYLIFNRLENQISAHFILLKSDLPIALIKEKDQGLIIFPKGKDSTQLKSKVQRIIDDYHKVYPLNKIHWIGIDHGESLKVKGYTLKRLAREILINTPTEKYVLRFDYNKPWYIENIETKKCFPLEGGMFL